ncbi:glycosyltransferase family 2 protein [Romboutsia lituseburensis]|uniref:glycosyltransferase family 2 protein n=1 Tax=Romboutsia lituseburensis TaxID=1537 RepID=UPI00215B2131|nr:glycosyltransferase family 2 protein [Romboutsia lituseburensis]MCR8746795.1 glycosyltransferase family 2 protein [Romboutsia lituseburensis]
MNIAISVIIPCYNCENYIERTIESIKNQTFENFELIIIDDGSTDNSISVCDRLLNNSNLNYKIVSQENGGVSKARNTGINHSRGKYIYMLDSDDFIEPELLEKMNKKLEENKLDIVFCGYDMVDEYNNQLFSYNDKFNYLDSIISGIDAFNLIINQKIILCTGSAIYKSELINKYNIRHYEHCSNGEDQEFQIKSLIHASRVGCVNEILLHYFQRRESMTHSTSLKRFAVLGAMKRIEKYLKNLDFDIKYINYFKHQKYAREFILNFSGVATECNSIDILIPLIKNKNNKKRLKKYKLDSFNFFDIKIWIGINLYKINPLIYAKFLNEIYRHKKN